MSTVEITKLVAEGRRNRFVLGYYLLSVLTGTFFFLVHGRLAFAADVAVGVFYLAATVFFHGLSLRNRSSRHDSREQRDVSH